METLQRDGTFKCSRINSVYGANMTINGRKKPRGSKLNHNNNNNNNNNKPIRFSFVSGGGWLTCCCQYLRPCRCLRIGQRPVLIAALTMLNAMASAAIRTGLRSI